MAMSITVIVPTHDRPDALKRTVESVLAQSRLPDEMIVINDGAEEIDAGLARDVEAAGVRFVDCRRGPPSSAASRNCGLELAGGDVAAMLDDDVVASADFLARLEELYEADAERIVGGICARYVEPARPRLPRRVWQLLAAALAENRWAPRVSAARYAKLPRALRGRLEPTWRFVGGAASLRRRVYQQYRFTEAFGGYSLGEDTELSFRIGAREALFCAPELTVEHVQAAGGRPENYTRGRSYAANMFHIARNATPGGAGTWMLLGYHLAGIIVLAILYSLVGWRRRNLRLAAGLAAGLMSELRASAGRQLCGC